MPQSKTRSRKLCDLKHPAIMLSGRLTACWWFRMKDWGLCSQCRAWALPIAELQEDSK